MRIDKKEEGRIKKILDILSHRRIKFNDLIDEVSIPKASLSRILGFLGPDHLSLIKKDEENYWCRTDYISVESDREEDRLLKHSQWLVPGLEATFKNPPVGRYGVADEEIRYWKEAEKRQPFAEQHIQSYPKIFNAFKEYKRLESKLKELGSKKIGDLSIQAFESRSARSKDPNRWEAWLRKHFPSNEDLNVKMHETLRKALQSSTLEETNYFIEKLKACTSEGVGRFLEALLAYRDFLETKKEMEKAYQEMSSGIQMLIFKIEGGRSWLKGTCDLCRVKIKIPKP